MTNVMEKLFAEFPPDITLIMADDEYVKNITIHTDEGRDALFSTVWEGWDVDVIQQRLWGVSPDLLIETIYTKEN
jgi:hypothetical protein